MGGTEASQIVIMIASAVMVTIIYKYFQTVKYGDRDPNFMWNVVFTGKLNDFPQTTENQKWAFFFLSTVNLLVCLLIVITFIILLGFIK